MRNRTIVWIIGIALLLLLVDGLRFLRQSPLPASSFENSMVLAPLYVEYLGDSDSKFAEEASELKKRIGSAPYIRTGFAGFLRIRFPDVPLNTSIGSTGMAESLNEIDTMVARARQSGIVTHVSIISGFFHDSNALRYGAIRQDVRNAQWFSDGWIAEPSEVRDPKTVPLSAWITPSRYAKPLRTRIEEGVRLVGSRLAARMHEFPDTLLTVSGDGEVELSYERQKSPGSPIADYSPFMVEEFRDWLRDTRYAGDLSPTTDDNSDGHTFDRDFGQNMTTWKLRYFDASGPIPFSEYVALPEKIPTTGRFFTPGGFDAPRAENPNDAFWNTWVEFRKRAIANWVRDFAEWITTSKDPETGFTIPPSHFYSHQIPADFLFGRTNDPRLRSSASFTETALIAPIGSPGVTILNAWNGKKHSSTMTPRLLTLLSQSGGNWAVAEYGASIPVGSATAPTSSTTYYRRQLDNLYASRPHLIVPILWSDSPIHKHENIKGSPFERALHAFVARFGSVPWSPRR